MRFGSFDLGILWLHRASGVQCPRRVIAQIYPLRDFIILTPFYAQQRNLRQNCCISNDI